ncbi:prokineticin receptor 2-like [Saccoglossus kowalevskii]
MDYQIYDYSQNYYNYNNYNYYNYYNYYTGGNMSQLNTLYFPEVALEAKIILGIVYSMIIIVCGTGNLFLCYAIYRFRRMRTTTNLLIGNLALSDFLVAVVCTPFNFYYYVNQDWPYGNFMCVFVSFLKFVSLYVSTNSLLIIAVDRYYTIMYPLRVRIRKFKAILIVVFIWIFSMVISLPSAIHTGTWAIADSTQCGEIYWSSPRLMQANTVFLIVCEFCIPLTLVTVAYSIIARTLWLRKIPGADNQLTKSQENIIVQSKRRSVRMLITVIALFAVCWIPYYLYCVVRDFYWGEKFITTEQLRTHLTIFYVVESVAMSNSMFNTLIYVFFNANYRKCVEQIVDSWRYGHRYNTMYLNSGTSKRLRQKRAKKAKKKPKRTKKDPKKPQNV